MTIIKVDNEKNKVSVKVDDKRIELSGFGDTLIEDVVRYGLDQISRVQTRSNAINADAFDSIIQDEKLSAGERIDAIFGYYEALDSVNKKRYSYVPVVINLDSDEFPDDFILELLADIINKELE